MRFRVNPSSDVPPSRQLNEQLLDRIASGALGPGAQIPSVRALAAEALVNPNTAGKAVRELELLGVVVGRNGLGVFVSDAGPAIARARREQSTLANYDVALSEALRVGHAPRLLLERFDAVVARAAAMPEPATGTRTP